MSVAVGARHHRRGGRVPRGRRRSSACGSPRRCSAPIDRVSRSTGHAGGPRPRVHAGLRRAGRPRQAGPDRRGVRRRHRPRPDRPVRAHPAGAGPGRAPLHPGVLPPDRHRRRHQRRSAAARCCGTPAILLAVAVVGKLVSPLGAIGAPGDKPLIGLGHAAPWRGRPDLRHHRAAERRARATTSTPPCCSSCSSPPWSRPSCSSSATAACAPTPGPRARRATPRRPRAAGSQVGRDEVGLGRPPARRAGRPVALDAAVFLARRPPGPGAPRLARRRRAADDAPGRPSSRRTLLDVIERGNARSWRFLETTGVLDARPARAGRAPSGGGPATASPSTARAATGCGRWSGCGCSTPTTRCRSRCAPSSDVDRLLLAGFLVEALEDEPDLERDRRR